MAIADERSRHELYLSLEAVIGAEKADTLMSMLPPVGWADVATKHDLDALERVLSSDLRSVETSLRKDIETLGASVRKDIETLETSLRKDIETLDTSLRKDIATLDTSLRKDIATLDTSLRKEIATLDTSLRADMRAMEDRILLAVDAKLHLALRDQTRTMIFALIGALFTMTSLNLTAVALIR